MSSETNDIGETSLYVYNGLGYLVRNIWDIKKNAYGYHNVQPETIVEGEVVAYVGNNPVNYIDPLGYKQLLPLSIIEKFGGTVTYRNEKDEFGDTIYKAVVVLGEKKETFYVYPNKKYYKGKSHCNEMYGSKMKVPVGEINALLGDAFIDTNQYRQVISILLGVNPLTGTYKDAQEALTGQDIITGKNLSGFERAFAVAAIINPFGGKEQVKIVADMRDDIFIELVFDVGKVADNPELADAFLDVVKKYGSNADYDEFVDILKKYGAYADDLAEGGLKINIDVKPTVSNEKLKNIINDLYKGQGGANTIGNGTTMDAVRNEILTGQATNGKFHTSKLNDYVNALEKSLEPVI
ncbi:MAG: pre-toxin TG domain-containing protein [Sedimentibacter sp.]|uniref:pre-toxin TG domain-containing protein n=1 Tax=Sedimentibacter sp. TaxID=1960295 RepID=UPI0031584E93